MSMTTATHNPHTQDLAVRNGRSIMPRAHAATDTRPRFVLAIPYVIESDTIGGEPIPLGILKRMALEDFRATALDDLGVVYAGTPNVTVSHGEQSQIMVTCTVVLSSDAPKHVEARRPYLERGADTRTLADLTPRSLR